MLGNGKSANQWQRKDGRGKVSSCVDASRGVPDAQSVHAFALNTALPEMTNGNAHENPTKDRPQAASRDQGDQDVARNLEVLLDEDAEVLEQDRDLHKEEAGVVDPDGYPEPIEAIRFRFLREIPVVLAHAILDCGECQRELQVARGRLNSRLLPVVIACEMLKTFVRSVPVQVMQGQVKRLTQPAHMTKSSQPAFRTITIRVKSRAATANTPSTVPTVMVAMTADSVVCPEIAILRRLDVREARVV